MKQQFYPGTTTKKVVFISRVSVLFALFTFVMLLPRAKAQQGLEFKNAYLQTGNPGENNAVYRFPSVTSGVDALVQISGRSSSLVSLQSIDLTHTGFDKSFQPQVTYNSGTAPSGVSDWWMEFTVSFINASTNQPVNVNSFNVTGLDIDGNGDKINEWVSFYNHSTYTLENNSLLQYGSVWEVLNSVSTIVGTKFNGPVTNFSNIDTGATRVMATANYLNRNSFRIRTGGHSTGQSGAADRMYSFWFRSFNYQSSVNIGLPVVLKSLTAKLENKKPVINWVTTKEENLGTYVIERSADGSSYKDIALVFPHEAPALENKYTYTDNSIIASKGVVYYRLRMVDMDGSFKYSETRIIRMTEAEKNISIQAYPNPAINELRITIPSNWQDGKVQYEVFNVNGQSLKRITKSKASQTEVLDISSLPTGSYIIKVSNEKENAIQQFVKSK